MARQQTLHQYVKAQRSLLEAEALAHTQAMQGSKQLENSMKDTIAHIRRSVCELDGGDDGAFKLKPPRSTAVPNGSGVHHIRSASRDTTLLQNGLIVEHDVGREEKKERERRRRQGKRERSRPRKTSRSSATMSPRYTLPIARFLSLTMVSVCCRTHGFLELALDLLVPSLPQLTGNRALVMYGRLRSRVLIARLLHRQDALASSVLGT